MTRILFIIAFLFASSAHALIVDEFFCEVTITDETSGHSVSKKGALVAGRYHKAEQPPNAPEPPPRPTPVDPRNSSRPHQVTTFGWINDSINLTNAEFSITLDLNFIYEHEYSYRKPPVRANQNSCFTVQTSMCAKDQQDPANCSVASNVCMWRPFPVRVVDGVPEFDDRDLSLRKGEFVDADGNTIAHYSVSCSHQLTAQ